MVYTNNEEGMRQDFHLLERPEGDGPVRVELRYAGDLIANPDGMHAIVFSRRDSNGVEQPLLRYKDLLAWDADGDVLHAWMGVNEDHITLSVDDSEAR
ncbi:MAG TPA: hypothetical protein PLL57_06500, partial [Flavobacteriales bacterium]|nr:hypothetical protein [Flavobacteriales bacterium]